MLDFAKAVCRCDTITEPHFLSLEEVGFDREDAWDIAAIAAFFAMSNRLAHLADMRPNLEFYNMGRIPRDKSNDKVGEDGKWNELSYRHDYKNSKIMCDSYELSCVLYFYFLLMWTIKYWLKWGWISDLQVWHMKIKFSS